MKYLTKLLSNSALMTTLVQQLDLAFFALSDRTRRKLLEQLSRAPARISDLAGRFHQSLPAISRHLKVLEEAGLLKFRKNVEDGRSKTCELCTEGYDDLVSWIETNRALWEKRLDAMEKMLAEEIRGKNE